ncbi:MAG: 4-hydroxy-tetrahydrodipicolinate synthase [Candidatus Altiarchaeales archaeon HGW-Altiarchaeales-1]|nr:MAG: 4-hydroxy-tetrahydrodipicolinate synthase [Candidatus Altiarchaeales archaeon HGW-Altiarchaeales-1]
MNITGCYTAIVTPFKKNLEVDYDGLRENIKFQIDNGIDGVVPCGTTGEAATLSMEEHEKVIDTVVDESNGKIKIIAGTGSNNTAEAIELTKHAKDAGADACLLITPYYNKPTQEGIYQHYKKIAETIDIPLIPYNIKSRTGINIEPDTTIRLSRINGIIGVKEASDDLDQISGIINKLKLRNAQNFILLSGDDGWTLPIIALGGKGVISVVSNIMPKEVKTLTDCCLSGNFECAREIHYKLLNLTKTMFIETNPAPVKYAMNVLKENGKSGMNAGNLRLPLVEVSDASKGKIKEVLKEINMI